MKTKLKIRKLKSLDGIKEDENEEEGSETSEGGNYNKDECLASKKVILFKYHKCRIQIN